MSGRKLSAELVLPQLLMPFPGGDVRPAPDFAEIPENRRAMGALGAVPDPIPARIPDLTVYRIRYILVAGRRRPRWPKSREARLTSQLGSP